MVEETGILNRSRINCFLYMDACCRQSLPTQQRSERYIGSEIGTMHALMQQCRTLHTPTCELHWQAWFQDHPNNHQDMAAVYAEQSESEAEASERLESPDLEGFSEEDSYLPHSTQ
jgi:hypothetical protein